MTVAVFPHLAIAAGFRQFQRLPFFLRADEGKGPESPLIPRGESDAVAFGIPEHAALRDLASFQLVVHRQGEEFLAGDTFQPDHIGSLRMLLHEQHQIALWRGGLDELVFLGREGRSQGEKAAAQSEGSGRNHPPA